MFNTEVYDLLMKTYTDDHDDWEERTEEEKRNVRLTLEWVASQHNVAPSKQITLRKYKLSALPKKSHRFITVSVKKDANPKDLATFMERFISKHNYSHNIEVYTLEFTNAEMEYHPHIHILFNGTDKPQKGNIIRDFSRLFKIEPNFIDIQTSNDPLLYETRRQYCFGEKQNIKEKQVKQDMEIRKANNLLSYYSI
ncbi:MAG: putative replication initiation protein [Circoviridae sp.]|nr:MAG: putative replication initiation protein [Circoviridae sp.]